MASDRRALSDPPAEKQSRPEAQNSALDRRYAALASRVNGTAGGRVALKVVVFLVGLFFVVAGVLLVALPGPLTIPPLLVGVYVWSLEFSWARRLRVRVNRSARAAWADARQHPARAITITVLGLVAAVVVVWAVLHFDLVQRAKDLF